MVRVLSLSGTDISTRALTPEYHHAAFGVWLGLVGGEALASYQSLYLHMTNTRLHLNTFRGVRAISQFD